MSSNNLSEILKKSEKEVFLGNQNLGIARLNKRKKSLSKKGQEIFLWREEIAQRENIPPNFIFNEKLFCQSKGSEFLGKVAFKEDKFIL